MTQQKYNMDVEQQDKQNPFNHQEVFNMNKRHGEFPTLDEKDDEYSMNLPRKKSMLLDTNQDPFQNLPSDCVFNIFSFLPSTKDRFSCAAVSKEWLFLQAYMQTSQFRSSPTSLDNSMSPFQMYHSRCLEGKHANDARLAAISVGTCGEGILSELCIRGGLSSQGLTDLGLGIIARACSNLKSLSLWDCSRIASKGIDAITKECQSLEKLHLVNLPLVDDAGLFSVAYNCPKLLDVTLEFLPLVGNESLNALAKCSSHLVKLSLEKCPLAGDQGIIAVISHSPMLQKLNIASMNIGYGVLEAICHHGRSLSSLSLENIPRVTELGFSALEVHQNLRFLSLRSFTGLSDESFKTIGKRFTGLKQVTIQNCEFLTDIGLKALTKSTPSLESLKLVKCNNVTLVGLSGVFLNCSRSLKVLSLVKCQSFGLRTDKIIQLNNPRYPCLRSLTIEKCYGIGDKFLSSIGNACAQVMHLRLIGQTSITDRGVIALTKTRGKKPKCLTNVDLSGCSLITDISVVALTSLFGEKLQSLMLAGCGKIGDLSLKMISELCPCLVDLELSKCGISDCGVFFLAKSPPQQLEVLSLGGCARLTDRSLRCLQRISGRLMGLNLKCCSGLSKESLDSLRATIWWCDLLY